MNRRQIRFIKPPARLGHRLADLDYLVYRPVYARQDEVIVDLSGLRVITPVGVVGLLTLLERLARVDTGLRLITPKDAEVMSYFGSIGLLNAMEGITRVAGDNRAAEALSPKVSALISVTSFQGSDEVEKIAVGVEEAFQAEPGLAPVMGACYTVVTELANNVIEHSGGATGWVFAQRYAQQKGAVIEIAIGDAGMGIRESLARSSRYAGKIKDDRMALKLAIQEGASRLQDPHRGFGLGHIRVQIGEGRERRLVLASGEGRLVVYDDGSYRTYGGRVPVAGVLGYARVPC